ncbi:MAG: hypothetical protein WCI18_16010 [Pseudomonadota bacterium]
MKALLLVVLTFLGCSGESDRVEAISKLRALGVSATPSFVSQETSPGAAISLEFLVAVPKDHVITAEEYDISKAEPFSFKIKPDPSTITYQDVGDLRIAKVTAAGVLPAEAAAIDFRGVSSFGMKYGLTIKDGGESENIVGAVLIFKEGTTPAPSGLNVTINDPVDFSNHAEANIAANLQNPTSEKFKVSWFVSSGEIKNRRALTTKWTPNKSGEQALIVTARGLDTGAFTMSSKVVTVK